MLRGLDASSVQAAIPFDALPSDIRFVILKAQQGNDGFDPWYHRNAKAAADRGIHVFAYCFAYPLPHLDPVKQAELFVSKVGTGKRIFLDYEWPEIVASKPGGKGWKEWGCNPVQLGDWMRRNAEAVHAAAGMAPSIYTYDWWWSAVRDGIPGYGHPHGADVEWAADYDLWMAWYVKGWPKAGDRPRIPAPWKDWLFWQFDGNGGLRLPNGIDSDFCVFNGSEADLERWARGEALVSSAVPDVNTVSGVQARLTDLGYTPGAVDGSMGPRTLAAVKAFQRDRGLTSDGVVGPATRKALLQ